MQVQSRKVVAIAAISGAVVVLLGAFAAHGLKAQLTPKDLETFNTAVRYDMWHILAVFVFLAWTRTKEITGFALAAILFWFLGMILFCGSLYLWAPRELLGIADWRWLMILTPLGGVCFVLGWIMAAISCLRMKRE